MHSANQQAQKTSSFCSTSNDLDIQCPRSFAFARGRVRKYHPRFMPVPLLDLNAQNLALESELKTAFEKVLRSGHFIMGPAVTQFEEEIAAFTGAKHAIGVSSGTDAILLALMALDIKAGDEVLCPTYTFFATAGCVARAGAVPVFVDSCPVCFNIDAQDARRKVTAKTKAIIPVHLFGQMADMDPVMALAAEHKLAVIEDSAQSLGARYKNKASGTIGAFGTYSFFPSKNLGAFGDAGLVVSNDDALAERARLLRTHGSKPKYYHKYVGGNFRLDALQAALLSVKLPRYNEYTEKRQSNAAYYTEKLAQLNGVAQSAECSCGSNQNAVASGAKIILPRAHPDRCHIWNQYTLRVLDGKRDTLKKHLADLGIGTEIYYPVPMHQQECFAYLKQTEGLPVAAQLAKEALSIPIFPELNRAQQDEVIRAMQSFLAA
jgi:dTDP-4-amino-4,6-dideoxygalactose transaminase